MSVVRAVYRVVHSVVYLEVVRLRAILQVGSAQDLSTLAEPGGVRRQVDEVVWAWDNVLISLVLLGPEWPGHLEDVEASRNARVLHREVDGLREDAVDFFPVQVVPQAGLDLEGVVA